MAIAKVADRGSVVDTTNSTTTVITLTTGSAITVGNYLVARLALDNMGSGGTATTVTVTDSAGNTWTKVGPINRDPGGASEAGGITVYLAYAKVATGYTNTSTVTFTYGPVGVPRDSIVIDEWSGIDGTTPLATTAYLEAGATNPEALQTPTAAGQLFYTCLGTEGPVGDTYTEDTDTTDGAWTSLTRVGGTNASSSDNMTVAGAYKIVTGTTAQSWTPTVTARDYGCIGVVFAEAATLPPPALPPPIQLLARAALDRAHNW